MKPIAVALVILFATGLALAQSQSPFGGCVKQTPGNLRIRVSPEVIEGQVIQKALPNASDLKSVKKSDVKVHILIDESGGVACAAGMQGDPALYERSTEAAKKWKFKPYLINGSPVAVDSWFTFHYDKGKVTAKFRRD
jgi:TonB-like protein